MGRFPGAYVGFRVWTAHSGQLRALNGSPWENGAPTTAECLCARDAGRDQAPHPVPSPSCHCGLYALHLAKDLYCNGLAQKGIVGAVVAWGRMEIHREGFRAEHALPVALCRAPGTRPDCYEAVFAWCGEWEVPLCPTLEELEVEAKRYADRVPVSTLRRAQAESWMN